MTLGNSKLVRGAMAALALCACSTSAQMVVPPDISKGTEVVAAEDRSAVSGAFADESFRLGKLAIDDVDRDWNSGRAVGALGFSAEKVAGGYSYTVKGEGVDLSGGCITEKKEASLSLGGGFGAGVSFAKLGCTCSGAGEPTKVVVSAGTDGDYTGELQTHAGAYRVTALTEAQGMMSNGLPTGYRVDGDSPRGAVEVLKPGRVWFARDIDEAERHDLACLYVGLMLYMPPDD